MNRAEKLRVTDDPAVAEAIRRIVAEAPAPSAEQIQVLRDAGFPALSKPRREQAS